VNARSNGMASHFMLGRYLEPAMGFYASSPSESQPRALRGAVTAMVEDLSTVSVHAHRQHSDVTP
jgi:hypothetical protein